METPGNRLKIARNKLALTQKKMGERLGLEWYQIKDIESEKVQISLAIAKLLYYEFGINSEWLLTGKGEPFISSSTETTPPKDVPQYILDLLRKTERVLKSESMYCNLLAGAIMAYDKSLTEDEEKLAEKRRLNALESQFKECVAQLNDFLETKKYSNTGD